MVGWFVDKCPPHLRHHLRSLTTGSSLLPGFPPNWEMYSDPWVARRLFGRHKVKVLTGPADK
jgi:hypothetical protein